MKKIFVAGHNGMVGSAISRIITKNEKANLVFADRNILDLTNQGDVEDFFNENDFDHVILAAAKVGGIHANNTFPADFIYQNLMIQSNVINSAHNSGVQNLIFLGSSCIYPRMAPQPIPETSLLKGRLEPTNEPYAISKIAGIKLCESYNRQFGRNYRSLMPTNLYGPNDNFHPTGSHVLPALIRRFHESKVNGITEVYVWGSGNPLREFLHVDDLASACLFMMKLDSDKLSQKISPMQSHINVGTGVEHSIKEIATMISDTVGYTGKIRFDSSKPDGTPRKLLDVSILKDLGWNSSIPFEIGLSSTYEWFKENIGRFRG